MAFTEHESIACFWKRRKETATMNDLIYTILFCLSFFECRATMVTGERIYNV